VNLNNSGGFKFEAQRDHKGSRRIQTFTAVKLANQIMRQVENLFRVFALNPK